MKVSSSFAVPLVGLLLILGSSLSQSAFVPKTIDWTVPPTTRILQTDECYAQIKNLKRVWTGDCEGSYAAMAASVI